MIESIELIKGNESGLLIDGSFKKIVPNWANQQFKFTALPMGYPLLSNDGVWIVETSSSNYTVFDSELDGLTIKVKYKSIYDEVFSGSLSVNLSLTTGSNHSLRSLGRAKARPLTKR